MQLTVIGAPDIAIDASRIDFGTLFVGQRRDITLTVRNEGTDELQISSIVSGKKDFIPSMTSAVVAPRSTRTVVLTFAPSKIGAQETTLTLHSNDPDSATHFVTLLGTGLKPPVVSVSPASLAVTVPEGEAQLRTLTLKNLGTSRLDFSARVLPHVGLGTGSCIPTSALVNEFNSGELSAIDLTTNMVTRITTGLSSPHQGVAVSQDGASAYVVEPYAGRISKIDLATGARANAGTGLSFPVDLALKDSDRSAYVVNSSSGQIVDFDFVTLTQHVVASGLSQPFAIAMAPGGASAYVAELSGDRVSQVDLATGSRTTVASGFVGITDVALDDSGLAYVVDYDAGQLLTVNLSTGAVTPLATGLSSPFGFQVETPGVSGLLTLYNPGQVSRVDLVSGAVTVLASGLGGPTGITLDVPQGCAGGFLSLTPTTGSLAPSESVDLTARFDSTGMLGGTYLADVEVTSTDPVTPRLLVPASFTVVGTPNLVVEGASVNITSAQDYVGTGVSTTHSLQAEVTPLAGGTLRLLADGDFGDSAEVATVVAEGLVLGQAGPTGSDCTQASATFTLTAPQLTALVADGHVDVNVQNSGDVNDFCVVNRHTLSLQYPGPSDLSFGPLYYGLSRSISVGLHNTGSQELVITSIASDRGEFVPSVASLVVAPRTTQLLTVVFTPSAVGTFSGGMTLSSNDPDQPVITLPLSGEGIVPPDIAVDPVSLSESLLSGQSADRTLTLSNTGGSDLAWSVEVREAPSALRRASAASARRSFAPYGDGAVRLPAGPWSTSSSTAGVSHEPSFDATEGGGETGGAGVGGGEADGVRPPRTTAGGGSTVLLIQDSPPWGTAANQSLLAANGIAFDVIGSASVGFTDLHGYDVVMVASDQTTSTYAQLASRADQLEDYVVSGGVLDFHAAGWGHAGGNAALVTLPGGVHIQSFSAPSNNVALPDHPLMVGIPNPFPGNYASHAELVDLPANAQIVTTDTRGIATLAVYPRGAGYVIAGGLTYEFAHTTSFPGRVLANLIPYASSLSPPWLTVSPTSGTLAPGSAIDLTAHFSTEGLLGGDYDNLLRLSSNDPDEPVVDVPAHLHVTGAPDIGTAPTALDFGDVFIGGSRSLTLRVTNEGTDALEVTNIASGDPAFAADVTSFSLAARAHLDVHVTFAPSSAGTTPATLTLSSDDPDEPHLTVSLTGVGLVPPVIGVEPGSLSATLYEGSTEVRTLTVSNTGGSTLDYEVFVRTAADCAPQVAYVSDQYGALSSVDLATGVPHVVVPGMSVFNGVAVDPRTGILYAARYNQLLAIDPVDGTFTAVVSGMGNAFGLALDPTGTTAYVTDNSRGTIVKVDLASGVASTLVGNIYWPTGIAVTPDGRTAYVGQYYDDRLVAVDLATGTYQPVALDLDAPWGVTLDHSGRTVYVTEEGRGTVVAIDLTTNARQVLANALNVPRGIALDAAEAYAYVGLYGPSMLGRLNLATGQLDVAGSPLNTPQFVALGYAPGCTSAFLHAAPVSGSIPAGATAEIAVTFDTLQLLGGTYSGIVEIDSNDPLQPRLDVPATLTVIGTPDIGLEGEAVSMTSSQTYAGSGSATAHTFPIEVSPSGPGTVHLVADGDYGDGSEIATVLLEGTTVGSAGETGTDCTTARGDFSVAAALLSQVTADGHVDIAVQNSFAVDDFCSPNRHMVTLEYAGPAEFQFGTVYAYSSRTITLSVRNGGSQQLTVSSIASDLPEFAPSASSLIVPARGVLPLSVTFSPKQSGPFEGVLTIVSDDPDEAELHVPLTGEAIYPGDIVVSPTSISVSLNQGGSADRTLTIGNNGAGPLSWSLTVSAILAAAATSPAVPALSPSVLIVQDNYPWDFGSNQAILSGEGVSFQTIDTFTLPFTDLTSYDLVIVPSDQSTFTYSRLAAAASQLDAFVSGGGVLEFHAAGWGSRGGDASLVTLPGGVGIHQLFAAFNRVAMPSHPMMAGVPDPISAAGSGIDASHAFFSDLPPGASVLVTDEASDPTLVVYRHGQGTVVAGALTFEKGYVFGADTGMVLSNMMGYSLRTDPSWVSVSATSGTVPPVSSTDLTVSFQAGEMEPGDHHAVIRISNDDPDDPVNHVALLLHVIGVPLIEVSPAQLDHGHVYTGGSNTRAITVSSVGSETLSVTSLTFDDPAFTSDVSSFDLPPGESRGGAGHLRADTSRAVRGHPDRGKRRPGPPDDGGGAHGLGDRRARHPGLAVLHPGNAPAGTDPRPRSDDPEHGRYRPAMDVARRVGGRPSESRGRPRRDRHPLRLRDRGHSGPLRLQRGGLRLLHRRRRGRHVRRRQLPADRHRHRSHGVLGRGHRERPILRSVLHAEVSGAVRPRRRLPRTRQLLHPRQPRRRRRRLGRRRGAACVARPRLRGLPQARLRCGTPVREPSRHRRGQALPEPRLLRRHRQRLPGDPRPGQRTDPSLLPSLCGQRGELHRRHGGDGDHDGFPGRPRGAVADRDASVRNRRSRLQRERHRHAGQHPSWARAPMRPTSRSTATTRSSRP